MRNLRLNAAYNVLGWLLPALIFLALTPVMVRRLGVEAFGVVALIQVVTGYMNVLNFGFSEAITKQVAASYERDRTTAQRVAWLGFLLFTAFGVLGAALLLVGANWLAYDLLKVSAPLQAETAAALQIGAAVFLLQMVAEFYRGTSIGCQRFDVPNLSRVLRIGLSALFILWAIELEAGIAGVMWATLAGLAVGLVVNAVWMERILPLRPAGGDLREIGAEVLHYSKHVFAMRLANLVSSNLGQTLLGTLNSAASVALYQVPVRVAETGSVFLNRVLQAFFPGFAAMDRTRDAVRLREIFSTAFGAQALVTTPMFLCVALEAQPLLAAWIDAEFARSAAQIVLLVAIAYWLSSLTNLPSFLALSFDAPDILSKSAFVRLGIVAVAGYPLVQQLGLAGAAWLLLLAETQAIWVIREAVRRTLGADVVGPAMRPLVLHALLALAFFMAYEHLWRGSPAYTPWAVPAVALLYWVAAAALGLFTPTVRQALRSTLAWKRE